MSTPSDQMLYVCLKGMLASAGEYIELTQIESQIARKKRPNPRKLRKFHDSVDAVYTQARVLSEMFAEIERSELPKELQTRYDMVSTAIGGFFHAILKYSIFIDRSVEALEGRENIPPNDLKKLAEEHLQRNDEFIESLEKLSEDLTPSEVRLMGLE